MTNNSTKWKISRLESKISKLETEVSVLKRRLRLEILRKCQKNTFSTGTRRNYSMKN